jgi:DNA-directed RNA polymerase subunit RPC12/RpoP
MSKRTFTFEEARSNPCALSLTFCGGPSAAALEGHICENCAAALVAQIEAGLGLTDDACSCCGSRPARHTAGEFYICRECGSQVLEKARAWYGRARTAGRRKGRGKR